MTCTCEDALAALSDHLGLPLAFTDGVCGFHIDGQPFTIWRYDAPDRLVVSALVADDLPDAPSRGLVCDLLNLGYGMLADGLPSVARDPDMGFISVFTAFPCETLVAAEFPDDFGKFVAFARSVTERIAAERSGAAEAPRTARAEDAPPAPLPMDGFIQV